MRALVSDLPITFENVAFRAGPVTILDGVSLTIAPGAPTVLLGPNGSGKTTLIRIAMGLMAPTAGAVCWGGRRQSQSRRRAIVFQRPVMLRRSARANVVYALQGGTRRTRLASAAELLDRVGIGHLADRPARRLSAGEQQRLAFARALACDPEVLFLDEPTANLDPASAKAVEDIVESIAAGGTKIVMATHDLGQARRIAGEIVFLARGRVLEHARADRFFAAPGSSEAVRFIRGELVI